MVSTYNDSKKDLHKLRQIPRTWQCKWLQVSYLAPRPFERSFVFLEKVLFCTGTTGSIGWPSLAPRLHIDDCFEIHNFHWELCDLLLSSHQNFLHGVRLCQCVWSAEPLWFWSSGRSRNFGLSGSESKHCVYPKPHFSYALKIIHEKNCRVSLCVKELCHPQNSLWIQAAILVRRNDTSLPVLPRDSHFFGFVILVGLVDNCSSGIPEEHKISPFLPSNVFTWHNCGMGIYPTQISPFLI